MPGTAPGTGDTAMNKVSQGLCFHEDKILVGGGKQ